jgi:hypothetical protein
MGHHGCNAPARDASRLSDADVFGLARELRRAPPPANPRFDSCGAHAELPREDEDRVIRAPVLLRAVEGC